MNDVTRILAAIEHGDPKEAEQLLPLIYDELRQLAAQRLAREAPGQTLQPTALVHEAWLRLAGNESAKWEGRAHFFGAAAEAMRRILIENSRRKRALRHGGNVIILRHGATHADQTDAKPFDPADTVHQRQLNDQGRLTARAMGDALRSLNVRVSAVQSSQYSRAVETGILLGLGKVDAT